MIVDIVVIFVLLTSALISFIRGFIRETLTILGVIGGMIAAYLGGPLLAPIVAGWLGVKETVAEGSEEAASPEKFMGVLPYDLVADALAYGGIFITVVIVLSIVSHILAESAKSVGLGAVDRTFGVLFGLARGLVILAVLYAPFHYFMDKDSKEEWFGSSNTHIYLETTTAALTTLIPAETMQKLEEDAQKISGTIGNPREKLEEIEVLKEQYDVLKGELPPEAEGPGYDEKFRNEMDKVFQEGTDGPEDNMDENLNE